MNIIESSFSFAEYDQTDDSMMWVATNGLRWLSIKHESHNHPSSILDIQSPHKAINRVLQQAWINTTSREIDWRDVPIVGE